MTQLKISALTKVFSGGVKALDNFNLEMNQGEFIAIVGPSGCGKSTLLRILAGLETETEGSITLDGKEITGVAPKLRDMAFMFQNYALFPHLTLAENMGFGLKIRGTPKAEMALRVKEIAQKLGIQELLHRFPSEMSGGQRQRAALGRAILRNPKVFLFDEPLSNLDAKMRAQMRIEISRLHQKLAATMIFVTHDQIEAMTMGDRVVVLKDGVVQQVADPDTIYRNPANTFVGSFIGSPGMNLFQGRIEKNLDEGKSGQLLFKNDLCTFSLVVPGGSKESEVLATKIGHEIILGIRPEDIGSANAFTLSNPPTLTGTIGVEERLGDNICLYLHAGKQDWAARVAREATDPKWQRGESITLPVNLHRAVFFDVVSRKNLVPN